VILAFQEGMVWLIEYPHGIIGVDKRLLWTWSNDDINICLEN
jgi:hypothetical protein